MIKISFEAATPAALRSIIADFLGADVQAFPAEPGDVPAKRTRKAKGTEPAPAPEAPETAQETTSAPAPAPAPAPAVEAPAPAAEAPKGDAPSKLEVQKALVQVVKVAGREACGELCRLHGGPNLSALNPSVYAALLADAQKLLASTPEAGNE